MAYLAYDARYFYAGFDMEDPEPRAIHLEYQLQPDTRVLRGWFLKNAALTAQLQVYLSEHIDRSLSRVRGAIEVEGASLRLTGVSVAQSIQLSGSLKASISEILALTAEGQILITAEYGPEAAH